MTQKAIGRKLVDLLADYMKGFEFKPDLSSTGFVRTTEGALCLYQFPIYDEVMLTTGERGFSAEPMVWISIGEIENVYREVTLNKYLTKKTDFKTVGNRIADILANPDGIYRKRNNSLELYIFKEENIEYVAGELFRYFKETALPYFLNYHTVAAVDDLINTNPADYKVHMLNDNYRILKGTIAAKLNNNPHLDEVIRIYDKQLVERNMLDETKEEMRRIKEYFDIR